MSGLLFDLGGTFLRAGIAGPDGSICHRFKTGIASLAHGTGTAETWARILSIMVEYEGKHRKLLANCPVVISFPESIGANYEEMQGPTVAGFTHACFDLPRAIQSATGRKVIAMNDMSAACWYLAETTRANRFAAVTVSSGIGSKIFDRGHPAGVLDAPSYAGEIAHVVVDESHDAQICDCGRRGHLGAVASGQGIERMIHQRAATDRAGFQQSSLVRHFGASFHDLTNERHIVPAALEGDAWTLAIVYECTRHLIRSLLTVIMAFGLEKVFVMGGFANALGNRYLDIVRELAFDLSRYEIVHGYLDNLFEGVPVEQEICLQGCAAFLRLRGEHL